MLLTKSEAAELLHISGSTLQRRMRAGRYQFTKIGEGQYAEVRFTYEGLGLAQPKPPIPEPSLPDIDAVAEVPDIRGPVALSPRPLTPEESDAEFAARYKAGVETDSAGNKIDGTNERFQTKGSQSLLGPVERDATPIPKTGTAHMNPALLSDYVDPNFAPLIQRNPQTGEGFTRSGSPLCDGYSQEHYAADMQAWRRSGGGRSECEMEQAIRRVKENMNRSFPR